MTICHIIWIIVAKYDYFIQMHTNQVYHVNYKVQIEASAIWRKEKIKVNLCNFSIEIANLHLMKAVFKLAESH